MLTQLKSYISLLLLSTILWLLPYFAWADSSKIDAKLIIFTHISQQALNSENWSNLLVKPDNLSQTVNLQASKTSDEQVTKGLQSFHQPELNFDQVDSHPQYKLLSTDLDVFHNLKRRIKENGYRVILMRHWQQPDQKNGEWIHLYGGHAYDEDGSIKRHIGPDAKYGQAAYWQLDGKIRINHYKYYQVQANAYLTNHDSNLGINTDSTSSIVPLKSYNLQQKHATHLGKWLYFDHPLMGVLVKLESTQPSKST